MHVRSTSSHPSSRTILSSLVPPLFTLSPPPVPLPFQRLSVSPFVPRPAPAAPSLSSPRFTSSSRFLLFLFTSLFALSPFSSSESGLIQWKLFICLIATRRPGSSTLRRGNLRPLQPPPCPHLYPLRRRFLSVTTTSFAFHSVTEPLA